MELTKKFLNISIGIGIILCSASLLVYTLNNNPANAASVNGINTANGDGYMVAGIDVVHQNSSMGGGVIVYGYNPITKDIKKMKYKSWDELKQ